MAINVPNMPRKKGPANNIISKGSKGPKGASVAPAAAAEGRTVKGKKGSSNKGQVIMKQLAEKTPDSAFNPQNVPLGSKSDTLEFMYSLGDPSVLDNATLTDSETGEKVNRTFPRIIGYVFKVHEDMSVPDFGSTPDFHGDTLNTARDLDNWKDVKAGEVIDLTRVETAALLSQPQFNSLATGGDYPVRLQVTASRVGNPEDLTSPSKLPPIALTLMKNDKGFRSIKDLDIKEVLSYQPADKSVKDKDPFAAGKKTINEEFAGTKWEVRVKSGRRKVASQGGKSAEQRMLEQNKLSSKALATMFTSLRGK